jgi:hypothetical protein
MNNVRKRAVAALSMLVALAVAALCSGVASRALAAEKKTTLIGGVSPQEALRLGARMYRDGILPSGEPMRAMVKGDIPMEGSKFTCANCHLRSGNGSAEGQVLTSPIDGPRLYAPLSRYRKIPLGSRRGRPLAQTFSRPAYTDETLGKVLLTGVDPAGRQLDSIMPIYDLDKRDLQIMIYYLKNLSASTPPGVTDTTIRFATVIGGDVPQADRDAMLLPLKSFIANFRISRNMEKMIRSQAFLQEGVSRDMRTPALSVWQVNGPPATWHEQLETYYRKEPVFALLGGTVSGDWEPVHRFCEDHGIPAIFPITDFPVVSGKDWYTLYLSKGLWQEGETAAQYLHRGDAVTKDRPVVQVFRKDRAGLVLAKAFEETWTQLGHGAPRNIALAPEQVLNAAFWKELAATSPPAVVLLWLKTDDFPKLDELDAAGTRPEIIIASSTLLGRSIYKVPEKERAALYLTYPFSLSLEPLRVKAEAEAAKAGRSSFVDPAIELKIHALGATITGPLARLRNFVSRDYFLELIETSQDLTMISNLYPRMSFGQGQRYAAKGCYIVQLSEGPEPKLVPRSDWVIH